MTVNILSEPSVSPDPSNPLDPSDRLLRWYDHHHRHLPWRTPPSAKHTHTSPYHVWLSEIMLQQTTVAAVKGYFLKFIRIWPDVNALAEAELDDILRAWAGLGYYARARNLHKCAQTIAKEYHGQFPQTKPALQKLPGIGPYTAAAIAAIAFGEPVAAVDSNVERVISRYYALKIPPPKLNANVHKITTALVPQHRPGDFAQALMDLGATVCAPRKADCPLCPWKQECKAHKLAISETLPRKALKKTRPTRKGTCFWIERNDGTILLRRRPEHGLLGAMMEVPSTDWTETQTPNTESQAPVKAIWQKLPDKITHTFTHFHLELRVWKTTISTSDEPLSEGDYRWVDQHKLSSEALPSVMRKVCTAALKSP